MPFGARHRMVRPGIANRLSNREKALNGGWAARAALIVAILWVLIGTTAPYGADRSEPDIPGTAADAVSLGRDLDGDGDPSLGYRSGRCRH